MSALHKQGRVGDAAKVPSDSHGKPCCAHTCVGPAKRGSPTVFVNGRPALCVGDPGTHSTCCGSNTWNAKAGSSTVKLNNLPAHRVDDETTHCGGQGALIEGSSNCRVGG
jgi:uncharacterized Zn-binding protein involved in type VI secretion